MADKLTTFMCRLSWNPGASTSWNLQGLSRLVMGWILLLLLHFATPCRWTLHSVDDCTHTSRPIAWLHILDALYSLSFSFLFIYSNFSSEMSFCSCAVRERHFDNIAPTLKQLGRPAVCVCWKSLDMSDHSPIRVIVISYYHRNVTTVAAADRSFRL